MELFDLVLLGDISKLLKKAFQVTAQITGQMKKNELMKLNYSKEKNNFLLLWFLNYGLNIYLIQTIHSSNTSSVCLAVSGTYLMHQLAGFGGMEQDRKTGE